MGNRNRTYKWQNDRQSRLIGLFLASALLFNFPLLGLSGHGQKWGWAPVLFLYLGIVWVGLIIGTYWVMRDISGQPDSTDNQDEP